MKPKERMGSDPLAWISSTKEKEVIKPSRKEEAPKKTGRPQEIKREFTKSSQEGLREGFTRATFILKEDILEKLKDYAFTERKEIKAVVNEALALYLKDKKTIKREK